MRAIADILPNNESCYESSDRDSGAQSCSGYASAAKGAKIKKKGLQRSWVYDYSEKVVDDNGNRLKLIRNRLFRKAQWQHATACHHPLRAGLK